ncbi:MAG: DUF4129 domain-containing protein [Anaerolineae bacterium]|nr:DUF4129 domain-containing protein [Anaerolineae bacterium]
MNLSRLNWLDQVLIPSLSAAMRAAWIVPWVNALLATDFFRPSGVTLPFWIPLLILFAGSALAQALSESVAGRIAAGLLGVLVALGVVRLLVPASGEGLGPWLQDLYRQAVNWREYAPTVWVVFAVAAGLWMRAITIDWSEMEPLRKGFLTGVIALALLILVRGTRYGLNLGLIDGIMEAVLVFIASAMSAMALSDISRTLRQSMRTSGLAPRLGRFWYLVVVGVVVGVVAVGWLATYVVDPGSVRSVIGWFSPVLNLIRDVIAYVIMGIAYVIFRLLAPFIDWMNSLVREQAEEEATTVVEEASEEISELVESGEFAFQIPPWVETLAVIVVVAVVLVLFIAFLRRRFVSSKGGIQETREVDWSWGLMKEQIGQWWDRRRPQRRAEFVPLDDPEDPRAAIRQTYRRLLTLTGERGLAHRRGQTPSAFARSLGRRLPDLDPAVTNLTRLYYFARYAPESPTAEDVNSARAALAQAEKVLFDYEAAETSSDSPEAGSLRPG